MNTIIGAIAVAFSFTILTSCSQDYPPPTSQSKPQTGASRDTEGQPPVRSKSDTAPAATPERTNARKSDAVPTGKDTSTTRASATGASGTGTSATRTSATAAPATDAKPGRSAERSAALPDRGSAQDQGPAGAPAQPSVGVEQITSNRMQTIEGVVLKIDGDSYLVKDLAGNEVKLRADSKTKKDGNLTVGDKILARLEGSGVVASSITKR